MVKEKKTRKNESALISRKNYTKFIIYLLIDHDVNLVLLSVAANQRCSGEDLYYAVIGCSRKRGKIDVEVD